MSVFISTSNGQVGKIDNSSGVFTPLAYGPVFTDIAFSNEGNLFGITFDNLYRIDSNTGNSLVIGNLGSTDSMNALAFANDVLYATGGSSLYTINTTTGRASFIANLGSNFKSSGDLVFDSANNRFFSTSTTSTGDALFSINLNGAIQKIGDIEVNNVFGLTLEDGILYGYANAQKIVINTETGRGSFNQNIDGLTSTIFGAASFSPIENPIPPVIDENELGDAYTYDTVTGGNTEILENTNPDGLVDNPSIRRVGLVSIKDSATSTASQGQTWVVIHGWNSSPDAGNISSLLEGIKDRTSDSDRVIAVDWREASNNGSELSNGNFLAATWIRPVAELIVNKLELLGLNGAIANRQLNLIGHSLGSLLSSEIAAIYQENSGIQVKSITALDPPSELNRILRDLPGDGFDLDDRILNDLPGYDLDGRTPEREAPRSFQDVAVNSRAFVGSLSIAGNQQLAATAHNSFQMDFSDKDLVREHGWVVQTFTNLINQSPENSGIIHQLFSLDFTNNQYGGNSPQEGQFRANAYDFGHEGILQVNAPDHPSIFVAKNNKTLGEDDAITYGTIGDDIVKNLTRFRGNPGNDAFYGDRGNDQISGGLGNDTLHGNPGNDSIYGNQDNDLIYGGKDNDYLWGGKGSDKLYGDNGNDFLHGDDENDTLIGGGGSDKLEGGFGDDFLYGGSGKDTLTGGFGNDVFVFTLEDASPEKNEVDLITDFGLGLVGGIGGIDRIGLANGLTVEQISFEVMIGNVGSRQVGTYLKVNDQYLAEIQGAFSEAEFRNQFFVVDLNELSIVS